MVAVALAANIWLPRHLRMKYTWERDLSQRIAADLTRPDTLASAAHSWTLDAGSATPSGPYSAAASEAKREWTRPEGGGVPAKIRVRYQIRVPRGTFRLRENLRCWLPFPQGAKLIEAGVNGVPFPEDKIILSGTSSPHGSLFMETKSSRYKDIIFHEVYEYQFEPLSHSGRIEESDTLARWIRDSIIQAPMKEYSTIEDIPGQVESLRRGDEGGKALLFIRMCKDKGIPVRWRSGLEPAMGKVFLREWAEVSHDGEEWLPVHLSGESVPDPGSIILINEDFSGDLYPAKDYPRSDNVDFLRGEVEWDGGNLYFNQWNSEIQIEYLKQ